MRVGILGGGQLGRMSALAAARLGYRCHVFSPEQDGPGMQVAAAATVAPYEDAEALAEFADSVDVVTFAWDGTNWRELSRSLGATGSTPISGATANGAMYATGFMRQRQAVRGKRQSWALRACICKRGHSASTHICPITGSRYGCR